jgi:hypothetical protein
VGFATISGMSYEVNFCHGVLLRDLVQTFPITLIKHVGKSAELREKQERERLSVPSFFRRRRPDLPQRAMLAATIVVSVVDPFMAICASR